MMRVTRFFLIGSICLMHFNLWAQTDTLPDSITVDDYVSDSVDENMSNMIQTWYSQKSSIIVDSTFIEISETDTILSSTPDSVYIKRLERIPSVIPLTYNHIVRNMIEMYLYKKRDKLENILGQVNYYFPIFDEIFDELEVPNELKYMSVIESALNPRATSRTRAAGLWQFMYGTGKLYGLTINSLVDERRDPIKSTYAAVRFSKDLYNMFGDWQLVIAAYNCGPGNVKKAIRRSGGKKDFWDIYYYLPRETRGHVPAFIAAVYVVTYYREHNVTPKPMFLPINNDTIIITKKLHLAQVSEVLQIPITTLREMNPSYITDIVPAFIEKPQVLRLPMEYINKFIDMQDSIHRYKETVYFNPSLNLKSPSHYTVSYSGNGKRIVHVVKQGETIGGIAQRYRVSTNQIKDWNGFNKNTIRIGQKLIIYTPKGYASNTKQNTSNAQSTNTKTSSSVISSSTTYYTVRNGDTLWKIAQNYPGISADDIMKANRIQVNDKIVPGQRLMIPLK